MNGMNPNDSQQELHTPVAWQPAPPKGTDPSSKRKLSGGEKRLIFGVSGVVLIAMLVGGVFLGMRFIGVFSDDLTTASGAARAYMAAMERGDMQRAIELSASETLEGLETKGEYASPNVRISDVKLGEETYGGEDGTAGIMVDVSYKLQGETYRGKLKVRAVVLDGKPSYRVTTVPVSVSSAGDEDSGASALDDVDALALEEVYSQRADRERKPKTDSNDEKLVTASVGKGKASEAALLPFGGYELNLSFNNEFLADTECSGKMLVLLNSEGHAYAERDPAVPCLSGDISALEVSDDGIAAAKADLLDFGENCTRACDEYTFEPASDSELETLPDSCAGASFSWTDSYYDSGGWYCSKESRFVGIVDFVGIGEAKKVSLLRFDPSAYIDVSPSSKSADALVLTISTSSCNGLCGESDFWRDGSELAITWLKRGGFEYELAEDE